MLPTKILNHELGAVALLTDQFQQSNIQGILRSWAIQFQDLEDVFWQVLESRNLAGEGVQLDQLGALVGEPRNGRSDAQYKLAIPLRILINASDGSTEALIEILIRVMTTQGFPEEEAKDYLEYSEQYPGRFRVVATGLQEIVNRAIVAAMVQAKPAGVAFDFQGNPFPIFESGTLITYDHTTPFIDEGLGYANTGLLPDNAAIHVETH